MKDDLPKILLTGLVLGVTCAAVVWFLERFESNRLHAEVTGYLERYDEFRDWLATRGNDGIEGTA